MDNSQSLLKGKRIFHLLTEKYKDRTISLSDRIAHPLGFLILTVLALICSVIITVMGILPGIMLPALLVLIPSVYALLAFPRFGIVVLLIASYFLMSTLKFGVTYPVGTLMDGLQFLLIIGFFIKHKSDRSWEFAKSPVTPILIIWVMYNILQVFNPIADSMLAWLYTIRTVGIVALTYFLFSYYIVSVSFIRLLLKLWIGMSVIAALYTIKQEYFGFSSFEKEFLANDPGATALYFISGHWRKFSIFTDPVALAYNMVISSILCITLMFGPVSTIKKMVLGIFVCFFVMAMVYSGTRGSFILIPAAMALLLVLKLNKKVFVFGVLMFVALVIITRLPTSNSNLQRFQSAFRPSNDASFNVRKKNQKRIQPFIQSHPIGGGLGSTGVWGQRFSPNSYLASFPPDSGYVRVAVETGWIGLLIFCTLMFVILRTGIKNYFKIKDPELKTYCLAMTLMVFALGIGNYPQEAFVQYPVNIYFYLIVALITITYKLDRKNLSTNISN
jgi:putative inorganic carbon (HCO3(-)) transporter